MTKGFYRMQNLQEVTCFKKEEAREGRKSTCSGADQLCSCGLLTSQFPNVRLTVSPTRLLMGKYRSVCQRMLFQSIHVHSSIPCRVYFIWQMFTQIFPVACFRNIEMEKCSFFRRTSWSKMKVLSHSVGPDSLQLHGLQPPRLLFPWDSPDQNSGVGCPSLLQGIFPAQDQAGVSCFAGGLFTV